MLVLNAHTKIKGAVCHEINRNSNLKTTSKLGAGCKESQFYGVPFGQGVALIDFSSLKVISTSPQNFLISRIACSSSVI